MEKYFGDSPNKQGFYVDIFLALLIFISILIYIISTYPLNAELKQATEIINIALIVVFSIEIFLRFAYTKSGLFFLNYLNWIDLLAILSFWFTANNFQFLRIFRILRFFRFSKKYRAYFKTMLGKNQFEKLFIFKTFFVILLLLFVSSSLIYTFEKTINPNVKEFFSAFYFVVSTVTTVGFGDITAITTAGKIVTIFTIFLGIMIVPYNLTLLLKEVLRDHKREAVCGRCGLEFHESDALFCKHCGEKIAKTGSKN